LPYFASATHQEIVLGALSSKDEQNRKLNTNEHVHVYVRHLKDLTQDETAKDFIDWDEATQQLVSGARDRLHGLETKLRRKLGANVHDLHTDWQHHGRNGAVDQTYIQHFCDAFLEHQKALIDAELASGNLADDRQQRDEAHRNFGADRARVFAGRQTLLTQVSKHTAAVRQTQPTQSQRSDLTAPLILLGAGGIGKSALLAKAAQLHRKRTKGTGVVIFERYIGGVPGTESLMNTLTALTADIAHIYDQPEPAVPENAKGLAEAFLQVLGNASKKRPLQIYLDALDQLDSTYSAWMLDWLPDKLPPHVSMVVSVRTDTDVERSARRRCPQSLLTVPAMKPSEGRAMLKLWLADKRSAWFNAGIAPTRGRRLTTIQQESLLKAFNHNGSALWLKLAYEEASSWTSWDAPRELPTDIHGLIEALIDRRLIKHENHPKVFTERALAYLTAGRFGLSEAELGRALGTDADVRAEFVALEKTQRKWNDSQRLPPILWSRLYFDLEPYLGQAKMDGLLLMRWFHREFADVMKARFLSSTQDCAAIHGALAHTFQKMERELRPEETNDDALFRSTDVTGTQVSAALRRVMEQPWQLAQAGMHKDLQTLLADFGFCMGKCAANLATDFVEDYRQQENSFIYNLEFNDWNALIIVGAHLLKRGNFLWPSHKILLQIAIEHADNSAATFAAEDWLNHGYCDWVWLKKLKRPTEINETGLISVLEGHSKKVLGAIVTASGQVISWSMDRTLRIWESRSGKMLKVLDDSAEHAIEMVDGRLITWGFRSLNIWDVKNNIPIQFPITDNNEIKSKTKGIQISSGNEIISWSSDGEIQIWNADTKNSIIRFLAQDEWGFSDQGELWMRDGYSGDIISSSKGHTERIRGALLASEDRIISWSDNDLILWNKNDGKIVSKLKGHNDIIDGVLVTKNNEILSWSDDNSLRLWSCQTGELISTLEGHTNGIVRARVMPDGRLLSWSKDNTLRIWSNNCHEMIGIFQGHRSWVDGAIVLSDGKLLSWSRDRTLRIWDSNSTEMLAILEGHTDLISGACALPCGRILSWSRDGTIRIWCNLTGELEQTFAGHHRSVEGVRVLPDKKLLSWSRDCTLRFWQYDKKTNYQGRILEATKYQYFENLSDDILLCKSCWPSLSLQYPPQLIDATSGKVLAVLDRNTVKTICLTNNRLLSISTNGSLTIWDCQTAAKIYSFYSGHPDFNAGKMKAEIINNKLMIWQVQGTLSIRNPDNGEISTYFELQNQYAQGPFPIPDGRLLYFFNDGRIELWNAEYESKLEFIGHTKEIIGHAILPSGTLLTWSNDGALRGWSTNNGKIIVTLPPIQPGVVIKDVQIHGDIIVSHFSNDTFCLWHWDKIDISPLKLLCKVEKKSKIISCASLSNGGFYVENGKSLWYWHIDIGLKEITLKSREVRDFIKGCEAVSDNELIFWTKDDLYCCQFDSGQIKKIGKSCWIDDFPFPSKWEMLNKIANSFRRNDIWFDGDENSIHLKNRKKGWNARWHDTQVTLECFKSGTLTVSTGREINFIELMSGNKKFLFEMESDVI